MTLTINYEQNPSHDDTKILWEGISKHASHVRGLNPGKSFAFFLRDESRQIKGGCSGYIFYGCLYIDLLWVEEDLRGQRYGTKLVQEAEDLAKQHNCRFVTVNTMDFEALDFYKELGFYVEFERHGYEKDSIFYFLRKNNESY